MIKFTIAIIVCTILCGCAGSCISLEGSYKDYKGGLTWCQDKQVSNDLGRDVLQNDSGEKAIILPESELKLINDKLDGEVVIKGIGESEIQRYLKIVKKIK